jgi:hypothetical protein
VNKITNFPYTLFGAAIALDMANSIFNTCKVQFLLTKTDHLSIKISPSPFKAFLFGPRVSLIGNLIINISLFCYVLYVHTGWPLNMKLQIEKEAVLSDVASLSDRALNEHIPHIYCCGTYLVPCHKFITR